MRKYRISSIMIMLLAMTACNHNTSYVDDKASTSNVFGDSIPASSGLIGKIFLLPDTTTMLPGFDTMKALDNKIYTQEVNVPLQNWSTGFPGLRNRFEWFGIEYTCNFKTDKPGDYTFRLLSDDGSKLFIDDSLLINNDGKHAVQSKSSTIFLNNFFHNAKVQYFQGPRYQLALQLFWNVKDSTEKIFPGKNFKLSVKEPPDFQWRVAVVAALIIMTILFFIRKNRKRSSI